MALSNVRKRVNRWLGLGLLAGLLTYLWYAIPFWTTKPAIAKRYAADFNAETASFAEADLARPLLHRVWLTTRTWDETNFPKLPPDATSWDDPKLEACRKQVEQYAEAISLIREASRRPRLGAWLTSVDDLANAKGMSDDERVAALARYDPSQNPMLFTLQMPWLGELRRSTRLLMLDMDVAAVDGDADRVIDDFDSGLRLAKLAAEPPTLISSLVGVAMRAAVTARLISIHARYPSLLTPELKSRAAEALDRACGELAAFPVEWERRSMLDFSQRIFSNIGGGNGYLTREGWEFLMAAGHMKWSPIAIVTLGPVAARTWGTRLDFEASVAAVYDAAAADFTVDPWNRSLQWVKSMQGSASNASLAARLPIGLAEAIAKAEVAFSMASFDMQIASWVLRGLPDGSTPRDVYTGRPVFVTRADNAVAVFSTGPDRDLDHGVRELDEGVARRWIYPESLASQTAAATAEIDGDWRLWPPTTVQFGDGSTHTLQVRPHRNRPPVLTHPTAR